MICPRNAATEADWRAVKHGDGRQTAFPAGPTSVSRQRRHGPIQERGSQRLRMVQRRDRARRPCRRRQPLSGRRRRKGRARDHRMAARLRAGRDAAHGRFCMAFRHADRRHRAARSDLCALLHVAGRSGAALLLLPARLHGVHAGRGAVGQYRPARGVLGTDQRLLLPAHRLLVSQCERARRRAHPVRAWR